MDDTGRISSFDDIMIYVFHDYDSREFIDDLIYVDISRIVYFYSADEPITHSIIHFCDGSEISVTESVSEIYLLFSKKS